MSVPFRKKTVFFLLVVLLLCGIWQIGLGTYIHAKAVLAQILLESAWSETLRVKKEVKPWPWADTWPVGRLTVPSLGISRIVLAGASGSSLAFGPGHLFGSASPGEAGNLVIAGHRDTHFRFLQMLRHGDILELETAQNRVLAYRIMDILISRFNDIQFVADTGDDRLTLVTCYPFNSLSAGGPLRFIVIAELLPTRNKML